MLVYTVLRLLLLDYSHPGTPSSLHGLVTNYPALLVWAAMRKCGLKKHAPKVIWIHCWLWMARTNLCFRDLMWSASCDEDKTGDSDNIIVTLLVTHALNYNSFRSTALLFPITFFVSYYFQLTS